MSVGAPVVPIDIIGAPDIDTIGGPAIEPGVGKSDGSTKDDQQSGDTQEPPF
ncbi:hypothetical protein Atai01_75780 [Amycolatopsis taiwanensis]|uniref:Uncharacterized protein n=1 Tax=Amycolatopsis taiwanensis TaxID=342230 RepID=A0A9W6VKT8_9PSEU|nr:hypothetical protein Atai01_75780 [Amycolatopsis taiwanensis]